MRSGIGGGRQTLCSRSLRYQPRHHAHQSYRVGKIFSPAARPKKDLRLAKRGSPIRALKQGIPAHNILFETRRATLTKTYAISSLSCTPTESAALSLSATRIIWRVAGEMAADLGFVGRAVLRHPDHARFDERNKKAKFLMQESYFVFTVRKWSDAVWN